jgi:hypothetical protein
MLLALMLAAAPVIQDPRGFHFTVPEGFEPFPGFRPTATKLYAYGKNLGTPDAITITIDGLQGPANVGSMSCGELMHSIDRTVGTPHLEKWGSTELSGLRMLMTHVFGEVLVLCVDVPLTPNAISVRVSGKPDNEALLHQTFEAVLSSLEREGSNSNRIPIGVGAIVLIIGATGLLSRRLRKRPGGKSPPA